MIKNRESRDDIAKCAIIVEDKCASWLLFFKASHFPCSKRENMLRY